MNYLEFFHFDNHPFTNDGKMNYFYPKKSFLSIVDELIKLCRFESGIFTIVGNNGVGKTVILNKVLDALNNNDFTISVNAGAKRAREVSSKTLYDVKNILGLI